MKVFVKRNNITYTECCIFVNPSFCFKLLNCTILFIINIEGWSGVEKSEFFILLHIVYFDIGFESNGAR